MSKKLIISILLFLIGTAAHGAQTVRPALLRDGLILRGIEGKLTGSDSNDVWFFELGSDVTDDNVVVKAGTSLKLLPSATLENMVTDVNELSANRYMLWGRITRYKGVNFIFPETPTKKELEQSEPAAATPKQDTRQNPVINDPNDLLTIPPEVMEKLKAIKAKTTASVQRPAESKKMQKEQTPSTAEGTTSKIAKRYTQKIDTVFVDRTAFLVEQENDEFIFVLDALGRNVPQVSLQLLPCEMLELTEQRQSALLESVRFKIAGIMTKYKGKNYLLLQKATRVYSHGNFER